MALALLVIEIERILTKLKYTHRSWQALNTIEASIVLKVFTVLLFKKIEEWKYKI